MIRFLVLRLLFPLPILFFLRAILRTVFTVLRQRGLGQPAPNVNGGQRRDTTPVAELKKDPVCGTYVSAATSLTRTVNGSVVHFCSPECRDKYRVANQAQ
jgi:YHS domain-containing protein